MPRQQKRTNGAIRRQRTIKGRPRIALPSCVLDRIFEIVERDAARFHVSRSFVVATALCHGLGIRDPDQEDYKV